MTYLGQENDFVKLSYFFSKFEAYFRHLLCALPACDAFLNFLWKFCIPNTLNLDTV